MKPKSLSLFVNIHVKDVNEEDLDIHLLEDIRSYLTLTDIVKECDCTKKFDLSSLKTSIFKTFLEQLYSFIKEANKSRLDGMMYGDDGMGYDMFNIINNLKNIKPSLETHFKYTLFHLDQEISFQLIRLADTMLFGLYIPISGIKEHWSEDVKILRSRNYIWEHELQPYEVINTKEYLEDTVQIPKHVFKSIPKQYIPLYLQEKLKG